MKTAALVAVAALLAACSNLPNAENATHADYDANIGWLHGNCLAIKNPTLELPKEFTLLGFEPNERFTTAIATEEAVSGDECHALLDDRKESNLAEGYSFYKVKSDLPINIGIGFFALGSTDDMTFNHCSTTEGMIFSISEQDRKVWEGYYYLGYDSEPTCK